jgi:AraC-like DNA-binding protein
MDMESFLMDENQVEQIEGMTTEYPYCLHQRDLTDFIIPWHWHEELELGYIQEGASKIITVGEEYIIHQGDGFFINSNVMDMKKSAVPGERVLEVNHIFHPVFLSGHFKSRFEKKYLTPVINNQQIEVYIIRKGHMTADKILTNLYRLKELQSHENMEFQTRNILSETWLLLLEDIRLNYKENKTIKDRQPDRIRNMLAFIHNHYKDKITVAQIADAIGVSEREAMRSFRKSLHQSPIEYLISYRLNEAKKMLRDSELSITEICYQCGFSDSSYFGKVFRKAYGVTPREYRK